jgi:hypothetical protein
MELSGNEREWMVDMWNWGMNGMGMDGSGRKAVNGWLWWNEWKWTEVDVN